MWDCLLCGCRAIAASLTGCPVCRKGRDMPKVTTGGSSNAREALEPGYAGPEAAVVAAEAPAAPAAEAPAAPAADVEVQPEPEPAEAVSEAPKAAPRHAPKVTVVGGGGSAGNPDAKVAVT